MVDLLVGGGGQWGREEMGRVLCTDRQGRRCLDRDDGEVKPHIFTELWND